jgi:prepilin-type N-terminal cleavage/methylation domain-containing protein
MRLRNASRGIGGFALIELMVVVAILSLAAAFFVPRFLEHRIRKHQEECFRNLRTFYEAQKAYHEAQGTYATELSELGWIPEGRRYEYHLLKSGKGAFTLGCSGNIDKDPTLDQATIDESGRITQVSDDIKQ